MGSTETLTATAIVASENQFHKSGPLWSLEDVEISRALHDDELLIKMVATGVCHTDVTATSLPEGTGGIMYPKIAGHEGMLLSAILLACAYEEGRKSHTTSESNFKANFGQFPR